MNSYYNRMNIISIGIGIAALVSVFFLTPNQYYIYALAAVSILAPSLLGYSREFRKNIKSKRVAVLKQNKSLLWIGILLNLIVPIFVGLLTFYILGLNFDQSILMFIASACFLIVVTNQLIQPKMEGLDLEVFN